MRIRFGYVSTALSLWEASPARALTFTRYKLLSPAEREAKLMLVTKENIFNTLRMLSYNIAHGIQVYRFSSSIAPLSTHPEVNWDFVAPFRSEWRELGDLIRRHGLRVSFHPNQYTLFTSPRNEVTSNAVIDMDYHYRMLEAMGVERESVINIHVGGAYGDKEQSIERFHQNIQSLPLHIKEVMTLENDDKTYTAEETLAVCRREGIRLVFDYHHHIANISEEPLETLLPKIFQTWESSPLKPKIHISSPKSEKMFRAHADFVDVDFIMPFFELLREINEDIDVMVEAKAKDMACLKLVEDISRIRGVKRIAGAEIEWK